MAKPKPKKCLSCIPRRVGCAWSSTSESKSNSATKTTTKQWQRPAHACTRLLFARCYGSDDETMRCWLDVFLPRLCWSVPVPWCQSPWRITFLAPLWTTSLTFSKATNRRQKYPDQRVWEKMRGEDERWLPKLYYITDPALEKNLDFISGLANQNHLDFVTHSADQNNPDIFNYSSVQLYYISTPTPWEGYISLPTLPIRRTIILQVLLVVNLRKIRVKGALCVVVLATLPFPFYPLKLVF